MTATSPDRPAINQRIRALIDAHRPGRSLAQAFYRNGEIYRRELERIFFKEWLYAGHVSELAEPGAYFLFELAGESVIVARGADGEIRAFANVCRHRGSRLCAETSGAVRRFICPYHAWTYGLDGRLVSARLMDEKLDPDEWALTPVRLEVFQGLVFLCFSDASPGFSALQEALAPATAPFGLEDTKIAYRSTHRVRANWKLLIENYFECYHCGPAHPEYSQSHSLHMPSRMTVSMNEALAERAAAAGVSTTSIEGGAGGRHADAPDHYYGRYALMDGFQTGSEDGAPIAPLLGSLKAYDGGASDLMIGFLNCALIYADHMVVYRFLPVDADNSVAELIWFVRADAEEGRDYDLERLRWLWTVTTEADIRIVEANQLGVNSRFYQPGPYAPMESWADSFVRDYLKALA